MNENFFFEHFCVLKDFRQENKVHHKLIDIIFIAVAAFIADCNTWIEVAIFAEEREEWLRGILELPYGIPSHDTFQRVFENLNAKEFAVYFVKWTQSIMAESKGRIVAIDGKTVKRSFDLPLNKPAVHIVNAWTDQNKLVLGQVKTSEKSNEITAIPKLLDMLMLKGCIVTTDALGTQKDIVKKIRSKKGDYVLALKGNHPATYEEVKLYFEDNLKNNFKDINPDKIDMYETLEKGHGRIEKRYYYIISDIEWCSWRTEWEGLSSIGLTINEITIGEKKSIEYRYYINSIPLDAKLFAKAVRTHWGIESTHWLLDVMFKEDDSRVRVNNSTENMSLLRKMALNILRNEKITEKKMSLRLKRKKAIMNVSFLEEILLGM